MYCFSSYSSVVPNPVKVLPVKRGITSGKLCSRLFFIFHELRLLEIDLNGGMGVKTYCDCFFFQLPFLQYSVSPTIHLRVAAQNQYITMRDVNAMP